MRIRRLVTIALAANALSSCESSNTPAIAVLSPVPVFGTGVSTLIISPGFIRIPIGTSATLSTNAPLDFRFEVEWISLNPNVVSVTQEGIITGLNVGTVTIRARFLFDPVNLGTSLVEVTPVLIP